MTAGNRPAAACVEPLLIEPAAFESGTALAACGPSAGTLVPGRRSTSIAEAATGSATLA